MVARVHSGRPVLGIPELPNGGGRLQCVVHHEPPARVVCLLHNLQGQVTPIHQGEDGKKELGPNDACCDVGAVTAHKMVEEVSNDSVIRVCRNDAQVEWKDISDLEPTGVGLSIEEGLIEGSTLRGEDGGQDGYVVLLSQCLGQLQGLLHIEEEAEGQGEADAHFWLGRRWYPVTIVTIHVANTTGWDGGEHELYIGHHRGVQCLGCD